VRAAGEEAASPKGAVTKSPASPAAEPPAGPNKSLPDARAKLNSSPAVKKIVAALLEETEFEFIETRFSEALAKVGQRHGIPVRIDEPVFRDMGVGTDAPVTRVLDGISLHSALQLTLNDLGMTYVIQDENLVITSQDEGERLARQGLIYADDVKRELEQNPAFHRRCAKLTKTLQDTTLLDFDAAPLFLAVNFIRTRYAISIEVDTRELDDINDRIIEARCTFKKGVKLTSALDKMLAPLGLTYVDCGEYILVTAPKKPAPKEENGRAKAPEDHVFPEPPPSENRASDAATVAFQGQARQQADDLRQQLAALQSSYDKQSAELTQVAGRTQVMQAAYQSFLVKGLGDEEPAVRVWAARKLGELRGDGEFARPILTQAQNDPDASVRQAAATVLQQLPRDAAATAPQRPPRQKKATPAPEEPQGAASGSREGIVQLADRICHLDQAYNETLAEFVPTYDKMCSAREVEWKVLVQAIDDKDVKVRVWTVRTLGELGCREALVETALRDHDPGVRRAAQESLEKIRTSPRAKAPAKAGTGTNTP
jgi:hypothetical protein